MQFASAPLTCYTGYVWDETSKCSRCGETKPKTEFYKDSRASDGCQSQCKVCIRSRSAELYAADPGRQQTMVERVARWREENPGCRSREYQRSRDKKIAYSAEWAAKNPSRVRATKSRWKKNHPEQSRKDAAKRRATKLGVGGVVTVQEWLSLCAHYDNRCLACGDRKPLAQDHVIPLSRGGPNTIDNIQPLCKSCNSKKGTRTIDYRT